MWTTNNICCFNLYFQGYWIHLASIPPLYLSAQQPVCLTLFPILFNVSSVPRVSWLHYTLDLMTESDNHSQIWSTFVLRTLLLLMMVAPSCLGFNDIFGSSPLIAPDVCFNITSQVLPSWHLKTAENIVQSKTYLVSPWRRPSVPASAGVAKIFQNPEAKLFASAERWTAPWMRCGQSQSLHGWDVANNWHRSSPCWSGPGEDVRNLSVAE